MKVSAILLICGLWTVDCGLSDTVYTKEGKELKGIIVEDYKDRIIFSTIDGQITVLKSDVKELYFDTEEQNLIKLAEQATWVANIAGGLPAYDLNPPVAPPPATPVTQQNQPSANANP